MAATLEARDLYRFYHAGDDETLALRGVSLSVDGGEVVAVVGPSGSGKSTLLACLAGLDEPDGGMVRVNGERLSRRPEQERARVRSRSIGVLFQSANLLAHLDVRENALLAQRLAGRVATARLSELFAGAGIQARANALPTQLSGGELARAALVVALANDPPLLLADEPTGELDSDTAARIITLLRQRAAEGTAVVVVTHNEEIAATADRVVELRDGSVVT
ncbi:MAG TPA: ABC transporter ATP-binding protein [Gaiellaceae bacterium]|nr:ABC transporter ATP-binding protein [Gaiellaceae bacterium]